MVWSNSSVCRLVVFGLSFILQLGFSCIYGKVSSLNLDYKCAEYNPFPINVLFIYIKSFSLPSYMNLPLLKLSCSAVSRNTTLETLESLCPQSIVADGRPNITIFFFLLLNYRSLHRISQRCEYSFHTFGDAVYFVKKISYSFFFFLSFF